MKREALIVYDGLPIGSGGAHTLARQSLSRVRDTLETFLLECTDRKQPDRIQLTVYDGIAIPADFSNRMNEALAAIHGAPARRQVVGGRNADLWENSWTVAPGQFRAVADWLAARQPLPRIQCVAGPPIVLGVEATFKLRDPRSGDILPFQGTEYYGGHEYGFRMPLGLSRLHLRLSERSTWALVLCLPFTHVSEELRTYVATFQNYLPFELSPRHWSRWQLNARHTHYYARKVKVV